MALAAQSMFLSHQEGNASTCIRLSLTEGIRLQKISRSMVVLKVLSNSRKSTHLQLLRPYRGLGSRYSSLLRQQKEDSSTSAHSTRTNKRQIFEFLKDWSYLRFLEVAGILLCTLIIIPSADAVDALKTCACLLKECRIELVRCISNPSCAANIACLQTCNNRSDETECQIKCGDLLENNVVDDFNECAVSRKKCVPRKSDVGEFPVPNPDVLVKSFNIADFNGKWFITSGLNPTFDTFDCQLHEFHTESNKLVGHLSWRVPTPDGGFLTRSAMQRFVQDPSQPGILYNHDNEYLHYQDDW